MPAFTATAFLIAMFLFFGGATAVWLWLDRLPPNWDDSWYLTNSLVLFDALTTGGFPSFVNQFFSIMGFKAPLIAALPIPFYLLLGRDWRFAYLVNIASMIVLFAALFALAKRLFTTRTGLIAVFVTATMPVLYGLSRWYMVEYTLTAAVILALWLLVLSGNLEEAKLAAAFGVVCGFGLLLKITFPLFVAVPFLSAVLHSKRRARSLLLVAVPILIIALPWYALHWKAVLSFAFLSGLGLNAPTASATGVVFSLGASLRYFAVLARDGVSFYYVALAVALIGAALLTRGQKGASPLPAVLPWLAPLLVFILAGNQDHRLAAPLLPFLGLLIAALLDRFIARRNWILAPTLAVPLLSMLATSFGWPYPASNHVYARRFSRVEWPHHEILKAISADPAFRQNHNQRLLVGVDHSSLNTNNLELFARQLQLPLTVSSTAYETGLNGLFRLSDSATYFLYKDGGAPESPDFNILFQQAIDYVRNSPGAVPIYTSPTLPDGGIAHLIRKPRGQTILDANLPPSNASFGGLLTLTGLSVLRNADTLTVQYEWRLDHPVDREYWCFTHIIGGNHQVIGYLDHRLLDGDPPLLDWTTGDVRRESLRFILPASARQQRLRIRIGLYHVQSGDRLKVALPQATEGALVQQDTAIELER